jgi:ATP-dependent DNA helicase RecG
MNLQTPVKEASRAYKMYASRLEKLNIRNLEDFLLHIPFRYDDYSLVSKIGQIQAGETVTIKGVVEKIENQYTRKWKSLQRAIIKDDTGSVDILWFNQTFLTRVMKKGDLISLSGKVELDKNKFTFVSPDYEVIFNNQAIHTGRLVPVYPETKGISSKWLRRQIYKILNEKDVIKEYLPYDLLKENQLMNLNDALQKIHFPDNIEQAEKAKQRLAFEELFILQLSTLSRKKEWESKAKGQPLRIATFNVSVQKFLDKLPFELTNAQKKAVQEIFSDLETEKPMNRLLEGEVGSGKTVVATIAMYVAFLNGFQSVLMAPTEILAEQHYKTISQLLSPFKVKIALVTSSHKHKDSDFDILIGTHAVISEKIKFKNLALVVIDEQQRFGVEQRAIIRSRGKNPHLLTMTATPIPRTVALTIYGDLDLSLLDEMPKGRKIVKTWLVPPVKREGAYAWIEKEINKHKSQAFIICPFIEESESMITVKAAAKEFENLKKIFPKLRLGLLHGKLKSKDKETILTDFKNKKIDILVATPVVEVGIDIPNATIIMIEASERFGLAQLHQLRGRVGRGDKQSYCLLFTDSKNDATLKRLKSMESIYIGAKLAELDLKLRGAGDLYGTAQHGRNMLKVADFSDLNLIEKTKREASNIFNEISKYPILLEKIKEINNKTVSPD